MNPPAPTPLEVVGRYRGLIAVAVAATVLRVSGLAEWWLNPDEGIYYSILTRAEPDGFWKEVASNAHPPLYYLTLRGLALVTWDFFWFRAFSVLCGVAAIVGVWAVARRLGGDGTRGAVAGFLAAILLAFAPGGVELSQVMRPYMLQLALLSWAFFFLLRYAQETVARDLAAYVGLLCLALLTHYSSVLALGVFCIVVLVEGTQRGFGDRAWRRLARAHAVPFVVVALLYGLHLRPLSGSALANEALDGWLSFYMIDSPGGVWWSVLGLQHLLAHAWLRGPMALFLLATVGVSFVSRDVRVTAAVGGVLLVGILGAALGLYPLGATRHSLWVMAFAIPALGWLGAFLLDTPPGGRSSLRVGIPLLLIAFGGPVGSVIGMERAPWPPWDQVLRQANLSQMVDVLEPTSSPELIVMSSQTFYLLLPFYPAERESAVFSGDSTAFHFPYGQRRVLVSTAWDFSAGADTDASGHLRRFLSSTTDAFPELGLTDRQNALLLVGGWRPPLIDELQSLTERTPFIRSLRNVPGFFAYEVDLPGLRTALEPVDGG